MLELTTKIGTARASFRDRRGHNFLPVEVAGKTGTLSYRGAPGDPALPAMIFPDDRTRGPRVPYLGYSWFIGYAPAHRPRVAFAFVLGNAAAWRVKASLVARRFVADYLALEKEGRAPRLLAAR